MNLLNSKTLLALAILGITFCLWSMPWQTQDGPNHKKVAVILKRLPQSPIEQNYYQNNLSWFQTNQLFPLAYAKSPKDLSIHTFEKIFMGLCLALLLLSYYVFLKTWSPESLSFWPLILPLLFHLLFIQGMYNYLASIPLTLLGLTFLKRSLEKNWLSNFLLFTLFSYLAFLAHPFPSFIFLISLFYLNLFDLKKHSARLLPAWLISLGLVSLGFIFPLFRQTAAPGESGLLFKPPWELLGGLFAFNFPGYSILQMSFLAPFFVYLIYLAYQSLKLSPLRDKIFWITLLGLYFIFPNEGKGGAHLNLRYLPFIWLFLPLGLKPDLRQARWGALISLATTIYLGGILSYQMNEIETLSKRVEKVFSVLPQSARLYPINFDVHGPGLNYTAWMHLWAHYPDDKAVFSPYLFAKMDLMPLSLKAQAATTLPATPEDFAKEIHRKFPCHGQHCPPDREAAWEKVFETANSYDFWWTYQAPQDFLQKLRSNPKLSLLAQDGEIALWRHQNPK